MTAWTFLTNYGDSAVTLPLAAATLVVLAFGGSPRLLRGWLLAVVVCGSSMVLLKIGFSDCADSAGPAHRAFSPSGHAAMSALVYGGVALLACIGRARVLRALALGLALLAVAAIGVSRVIVHAHTVPEVVVGLGIGVGALALLQRSAKGAELRLDVPALLGTAALVVVVMHGTQWPVEPVLQHLGVLLHRRLPLCT